MTRRLKYKIEEKDSGKSIAIFLKEKEYSRGVLITLKKTKEGIKKNGVWAVVNEILQRGDVLEICLAEETSSANIVPIACNLEILYEDEDILVINKPSDMPIHPSVNNYHNTLANGIAYYFQKQNIAYVFRCINRLDRDTTGVTILAKHMLSSSILSTRLKERGLKRTYVALVEGMTKNRGVINLPIGREEGSIIKRKIDEREGKEAITHYARLGTFDIEDKRVSMVALQLETGRTHQIRVHMAAIGHPLLGDFLYNEDNHMLERQALHGAECVFHHPITGIYHNIIAPLPKDMKELIQYFGSDELKVSDLEQQLNNIK